MTERAELLREIELIPAESFDKILSKELFLEDMRFYGGGGISNKTC